jgi:hypothetical protein
MVKMDGVSVDVFAVEESEKRRRMTPLQRRIGWNADLR